MVRRSPGRESAFSLIELVIVLAIASVLGAIAIPRLSRTAEDTPLVADEADLVILHNAIERFAVEHHGKFPNKDTFIAQLTQFTDIDGNVSATKTNTHLYGPYLRTVPVFRTHNGGGADKDGDLDGNGEIEAKVVRDGVDLGWRYDMKSGRIRGRNRTFESTSTKSGGS